MNMKRLFTSIAILLFTCNAFGQNNMGTPYSKFAFGLLQDNYGAYTAMGGVSAGIRDNSNINFLNPASYTALDSLRFYFQMGITGEYVDVSTYKEHTNYKVAQNAALNMAFRIYKKTFMSFGLTQKSDRGFDLVYAYPLSGDLSKYSIQELEGLGGLNEVYLGIAYQLGRLSLGINAAYIFGKVEDRLTLVLQPATSGYYIKTQTLTHISNPLFTFGVQLPLSLSKNSNLILGGSFNFETKLHGSQDYLAVQTSNTSGSSITLNNDSFENGNITYPFRIIFGGSYSYKNKWIFAGDYTFQKMSDYKEFGENQEFQDYHKAAIGGSLQPNETGRHWWQRNKYMIGAYFARTHLRFNYTDINVYGATIGTQMPLRLARQELMLGVAVDLGMRGTHRNNQILEKYAKLRINIAFKEIWFMKAKIH
jgi:hypothetical protein